MVDRDLTLQRARRVLIVLSILGCALSYAALTQHVRLVSGLAAEQSWCNINAHLNCDAVNSSEWSAFFGIPVASYGLFFYAALVILSVAASPLVGALSVASWSAIVLVLTGLASLFSIALLGISEFIIGALCLICLALYGVNFIVFAVAWRSGWSGEILKGLKVGVYEVARLVGLAFGYVKLPERRMAWKIRGLSLLIALSAAVSVAMPRVLVNLLEESNNGELADLVSHWRKTPRTRFDLDTSGSAFADYSRGEPGAPIQIVEFADYECPACKATSLVMAELLKSYEGKYYFVFKNYPLDQSCNRGITREMHKYACAAAYFSRCAGEQGKFWEASELLFSRDAERGELAPERLVSEASKELGLDQEGVRECLESGRYRDKVQKDISDGDAVGLQGTPSIWVNGKLIDQPTPRLLKAIFESLIE